MVTTAGATAPTYTIQQTTRYDTGSITKLNSTNYRVWKMRMISLFNAHHSLGIVQGTEVRPPTAVAPASNEAQENWDQKTNEAMAAMLISMADEQVDAVANCTTPQQIWAKLITMYENAGGENIQMVYQQFFGVRAGDSPVKAMTTIQNLASQLHALNVPINDEAVVARVVSSLDDPKYENFREAWRSIDLPKQTSALLLQRLKVWEIEHPIAASALTVEPSAKAFRSEKGKRPKEGIEALKKRTKCNNCGRKGHWKAECRQPKKEKPEVDAEGKKNKAFMTFKSQASPDKIWFNDSGASQHHCGNMDWFSCYEPFNTPEKVEMADGSFSEIIGSGTVKIKALSDGKWQEISILNVHYIPGGANLFSENVMIEKGYNVSKNAATGTVEFRKNGICELSARVEGRFQLMNFLPIERKAMTVLPERWHERLAHINVKAIRDTISKEAVYGLEGVQVPALTCSPCIQAKSTEDSHKATVKQRLYKPAECIHADLVHAPITSLTG
jgi:hypothetical protein